MRVFRSLSVVCVACGAVLWLWSQPVSTLPSAAEQKDLMTKARDEVAASSASLDEALAELSRKSYAQPPAQAAPDSAIPWLRTVVARGVAESGLVRGSQEALDAWIATLTDGSRLITPVGDLPAAMEQWRAHQTHALDRIHEATRLEEERQHAQTAMAQSKPDSPELAQARDTERQREKDVAAALKAAQSDLEFTLSIPKPINPADRGPSPFTGPFNQGLASRIWLYANRSSALIGESMDVQIGLANDDGPNCAASQPYTVELKCSGCEVAPSVTLAAGERFKSTPLRITGKASALKASAAGLKDREVSLTGCVFDPKIHLTSQMLTESAPDDGLTPVAVLAIFRNDAGDPATNGHPRTLDLAAHGPGAKFNPALQNGHIFRDGHESLDLDECASRQELVSDHAGTATLEIKFMNDALNPPAQFHFWYIWRWEDVDWWAVAAVISWLASCGKLILRKPRQTDDTIIRAGASFLGSMAGAVIALEAAYLLLSHFNSTSDPRIPCAIAGLVGGTLGRWTLLWVERFRAARQAAEDASEV